MEIISEYLQVPSYLTDTVALAAVALIGYLFGQRSGKHTAADSNEEVSGELDRAIRIAKDLQEVTAHIRRELAKHQSSISTFQRRIGAVDSGNEGTAWAILNEEAEALLAPTLAVTTNLSAAYDQLRQHSAELMNFTCTRTDVETGVGNRRALDEHFETQFLAFGLNKTRFCLAIFSVTSMPQQYLSEAELRELRASFAKLVDHTARDTDFVARYSEDEFAVILGHTSLAGAIIFGERLQRLVEVNLECVVSGGIAEVTAGDDAEKLFSRVDSALYSARSHGDCIYVHDGKALNRIHTQERDDQENLEAPAPGDSPQETEVAATV